MPFWRRDEPAHKKLGRALETAQPEGFDVDPAELTRDAAGVGLPAIHGVARPRRWDAVVSAESPGLAVDEVHFVALPDGTLVVDEEVPDGSLAPMADAVEQQISPPYRAEGVRRDGDLWAIAATEIAIVELAEVSGDVIELAVTDDERSLLVDGAPAFGSLPSLERVAADLDAYVIRAERLDGDLFEFRVSPL